MIARDSIFIFDVDGVITNPHTKIPNPLIVRFIAEQLVQRKPVAIGTGRSASWLEEHLIPLIRNMIPDKTYLDNLFLAGEKGSVVITFSQGEPSVQVDEHVFVPEGIRAQIRQKVKEYPTIFDNGKKTMISIEIEGGENREKVAMEEKALDALEMWIQREIHPARHHLTVERSVIALDIQSDMVNKRLVAKKFLLFLKNKKISPGSFAVFGDSPSDIHIAEELHMLGCIVIFCYVGFRDLPSQTNFSIIRSPGLFDKGVIALLKSIYNK